MTELGSFYSEGRVHLIYAASGDAGLHTQMTTKLTCRNEGRSPAWIDSVRGYAEIVNNALVYVVVEYRDIFENKRTTSLGYSVDVDGNIYRQEALPERIRNT